MKAVQIAEVGGPEVLQYVDAPRPEPGQGQALVEIKAAGINYTDVYSRTGVAHPAELPTILGVEAAGVVVELGAGVTEVAVGDRVAYSSGPRSYAEFAAIPSWRLMPIPEGIDFDVAAAAMLQGMTAHYLSHDTYPLKSGDTALIHAGAGGVGLLLIQMAKARGATVITTVSTEEKGRLAREAGADHVVNYSTQDFQQEVMRITGDVGVNVAYDAVGVTTFDKSIASLATRGYMVAYGQASGWPPPVALPVLNTKSLFLTRPTLVSYTLTRDEIAMRSGEVFAAIRSGTLKIAISRTFPLRDAAEAHRQLEGRQTTGKLLLLPG
jgi:NADPH2:quinone reductase